MNEQAIDFANGIWHFLNHAIIALSTNAWPVIRDHPDPVIQAIDAAAPGSYREVNLPRPALRRRRGRS